MDQLYNHEDIQPKTPGEGKVVRNAIQKYLVPPSKTENIPKGGDNGKKDDIDFLLPLKEQKL